jgi:DNA-directed RNA polymerase subunit RPC12/RpoP
LVRPVNIRVEGKKRVVIYRINDLYEILDKKFKQWKEYYISIRIEIDNCRKSIDSAKVNRCRKSNHRIGYKEKPVDPGEFKKYKRVKRNLYEYREFIEQWKNDIINGVIRKGRPPQEVVRWRKLNGIKTKTEVYREHVNDVARERLNKCRGKPREVCEDEILPVKPPGKAVFKKRR